MSKFFKQALFLIPVAVIVSAPVVLHLKNTSAKHVKSSYTTDENYSTPTFSGTASFSALGIKKDPAMQEPFSSEDMFGMTYSIRKSMDPNTWMQIMISMMNPHGTSPEAMCAACHRGKDLVRYQKQFGPMLQLPWNQYKTMMDPHAVGSMTNPTTMMQMMHQIMAMPMQIIAPMMNGNLRLDSHIPTDLPGTIPNVMGPKQYEEWYNKQQKKLEQNQ